MKNGHWHTADEFLDEQKEMKAKRTLRGIALSIENEMQQGHKYLRKMSSSLSLLSKSIAAALFFICLLIIIKELKGTNFNLDISDWFKISSTVAEGRK